ncbi:MFS transporter [Epibacterium ulvae]|uniref:MFS transporter n=1 Tax=Epibacterium ulvae TaxID=1156985 RepID=UPI0024901DF0|nr:MFS transporter [Epibacterium ulvae]
MRTAFYFILVNFLSSVSMGVFLIALPWLIVKTVGSDVLIGVSVLATMAIFPIRKKSGILVDSVPRNQLLTIILLAMASSLAVLALRQSDTVLLVGVYFLGQIYLYFFYVIRSAITHEIASAGQFGRYNGILEIEGQVSTFVAGAITAYFFAQGLRSFSITLAGAAAGMVIAALITSVKIKTGAPCKSAMTEPKSTAVQGNSFSLLLLCYCGSVPFICVMLLNVIKPIVIIDVLQYPGKVLAFSSVFYTIGAITAGVLGSQEWIKGSSRQVILWMLAAFLAFCLLPAFFPSAMVLYISSIVWGISNGLSRITWQTETMNRISNQQIGHFFASISAVVDVVRVVLLLIYWGATEWWGYQISFAYLSVICAVGLFVFATRNWFKQNWDRGGADQRL